MRGKQEIYDAEGYRQKLEELEEYKAEIDAEKAITSKEKDKKIKSERLKLSRIFTEEKCGKENMHFVRSLIDRASFLRVELEYIEKQLKEDGCLDFFVQGTQAMWREHPLAKVHVQYVKSYREVITKLESYGKSEDASNSKQLPINPVIGLIDRGNIARSKYNK